MLSTPKQLADLPWSKENQYLHVVSSDENIERQLAKSYMMHTGRHLFLTGKAGSGKTTLLKEFLSETSKNVIVAAPTGVAAINAGGITLHSLFYFPLTAFAPVDNLAYSEQILARNHLIKHLRYRKDKLKLMRELDTLVIDEISMVRSDLMDAIDFALRVSRKNSAPFGGVQLIMIGDMYQLPPVVRENTWDALAPYYRSAYFFDAHVWQIQAMHTIELQKVYRQKEGKFVDALNKFRKGIVREEDIQLINTRYLPQENNEEHAVALTTHNAMADSINTKKLAAIDSSEFLLEAEVKGKFNENAYPLDESIRLKKGAYIMFMRNHPEGLYYNGKIATVLDYEDNEYNPLLKVQFEDDKSKVWIEQQEWKNEKYSLDTEGNVKNETLGSFIQFPVRLAWAVTVHKSQGLTLERVRLDLAQSFAPGQVYVALSRCTSLEGLTLLSPLQKHNVMIDAKITQFHEGFDSIEYLRASYPEAKREYELLAIRKAFQMSSLMDQAEFVVDQLGDMDIPQKAKAYGIAQEIHKQLLNLFAVSQDFDKYLAYWIGLSKTDVSARDKVIAKTISGISYFVDQLHDKVILVLHEHMKEYSAKSKVKKYLKVQLELYESAWQRLQRLYNLHIGQQHLGASAKAYDKKALEVDFDPKVKKQAKGDSHRASLELYQSGKSISEIAKIRSLAPSTIEGHLAHWVKEGELEASSLMSADKLDRILDAAAQMKYSGMSDLRAQLDFDVSFYELRLAMAHKMNEESA